MAKNKLTNITEKELSKIKTPVTRIKTKQQKEQYEREWESIILNDKKKALETVHLQNVYGSTTTDFDCGYVSGYESAEVDFKRINRITWVLTAVNVAILINLIVK